MSNGIPLVMIRAPLGFGYFSWREKTIFPATVYPKSMILSKTIKNQSFWGCFSIDSPIFLEYNECSMTRLTSWRNKK